MLLETASFEWSRDSGGYQWRDGEGRPRETETFLVPKREEPFSPLTSASVPVRGAGRSYKPFNIPTLWHRFASMEPTKDEIVHFADRFGELGEPETATFYLGGRSKGPAGITYGDYQYWTSGETLALWRGEIEAMRFAYECWTTLHKDDPAAAKALTEKITAIPTDENERPEYLRSAPLELQGVEGLGAMAVYLCNRGMEGRFTMRVNGIVSGPRKLLAVPSNLIGALWLQFTLTIDDPHWTACRLCGRPVYSERAGRKQYCGSAHRQAYRRQRKNGLLNR